MTQLGDKHHLAKFAGYPKLSSLQHPPRHFTTIDSHTASICYKGQIYCATFHIPNVSIDFAKQLAC